MPVPTTTYVRRLGLAHFAHLRAVVKGVPVEDAAERYLAADSRPAARAAHSQVLQLLSAFLRQRNDKRRRLVMLIGRIGQPAAAGAVARPTLRQWADAKGVDTEEWGER